MVDAGCLGHVMGFESITRASIKEARKAPNMPQVRATTRTQIRILREYGLQTWAAFTLGYDHDTLDSVRETLDFALENQLHLRGLQHPDAVPQHAALQPPRARGPPLYDGKWWLHPRLSLQRCLVRAGEHDAR